MRVNQGADRPVAICGSPLGPTSFFAAKRLLNNADPGGDRALPT